MEDEAGGVKYKASQGQGHRISRLSTNRPAPTPLIKKPNFSDGRWFASA
jgi:hypothetical protein